MVIQDTRGRFSSDGDWSTARAHEGADAYDTVEWAASQPWCDGNVALYGVSYPGNVALQGALARPPHLRAIAPEMTVDPAASRSRSGGAFPLELRVMWTLNQLANDILPKQVADGTVDPKRLALVREAVGNPRVATDFLPLKKSPYLADPQGADALFAPPAASATYPYQRIEVPALLISGWYDIGTPLEQLRQLQAGGGGGEDVRAAHRVVIGPWTHAIQLPNIQGDLNFGPAAHGRVALLPIFKAFFDRNLKGLDEDLPLIRYFLMGPNEWRDASQWPPTGTVAQRWYLHSGGAANTWTGDGSLDLQAPTSGEPADRYAYDPAEPVRSCGGRFVAQGDAVPGPVNQQHVELRDDVLCYTSSPFDGPVDVIGPVTVRLYAASSARDTDFVAKLTDVFPDGRSILLCEGMRRARYRHGYEQEVPLTADTPECYEIDLGSTAWRAAGGHRLRVDIASSNFPVFDRNLNTGNPLGEDAEGVVAHQTVLHDVHHPSSLEVNVVEAV
jgi:hypothetical protein